MRSALINGLSMKKERIAMATKSVMKRNLINVTGLISSSLGMDFLMERELKIGVYKGIDGAGSVPKV